VAGWISCVPKRTANRIEAEVVVANTTSRWLRPHPLTLLPTTFSWFWSPLIHIIGAFFLYLFLHSPIFFSLFPVSFAKLYSISHPSSLLLYSYSLLGPRWLIVYVTRVLLSSSPQTNTRFCHISRFISSHCETGLVSNAPRT
jgi:hypothetical protein